MGRLSQEDEVAHLLDHQSFTELTEKDMFFNRRHLENHGYEIIGLRMGGLDTCHHYSKKFEDRRTLVIFSTIYHNMVGVYKLTEKQWDSYIKGEVALSHSGESHGKTPCGHPIINVKTMRIIHTGEIKRQKRLKELLDIAERVAQDDKLFNVPLSELFTK
jgi:hypothetical protein